jgi:hypothetical protein
MHKFITLTWALAAVLVLSACDVQLRDSTPAEYPANHDIGMYEVSAVVSHGALVTPGSVFVFALGDKQRVSLSSNADGTEWRGLYSARCQASFPLQLLVEWKLPFSVKRKIVPPEPRELKLIEPPLTKEASFDSAGKASKGGWQGGVQYRFVTMPSVRITGAHFEPASGAPGDVAAAKPLTVVSTFPLVAACGESVEVRVASGAARAHGTLVIDTDHPADPHWQTKVEFSPK